MPRVKRGTVRRAHRKKLAKLTKGYFLNKSKLYKFMKEAADRGEPDDGSRYYDHWLAALERLVTAKGLSDREAMRERKEAWADAYRHTPHGKPVELSAATKPGHS